MSILDALNWYRRPAVASICLRRPAWLRRLPPMRPRRALGPRQGLQLLSLCNERYYEHLASLARSVDRGAPGNGLHAHFVNPSPEIIADFRSLQENLASTVLTYSLERADFSGTPRNFEAVYCSSVRFVRALELLALYRRDILVLDADSLVRASLDGLDAAVGAGDVVARTRFRSHVPAHLRITAGTTYFRATLPALSFLTHAGKHIARALNDRSAEWYVDQRALFSAYESLTAGSDRFTFLDLPETYADWTFARESVIWAGKGERKNTDPSFVSLAASLRGGEPKFSAQS